MVQCEMCGANTSSPTTIKVEGAKLDVCSNCTDFGTEVTTGQSSTASTKYSTSSSDTSTTTSGSQSPRTASTGSHSSGQSSKRSDMFDDMDELAQDYDDRIRTAREDRGLTQADLADELNEKASLINKLERGETLPNDQIQSKLESHLDIELSGGSEDGETEWSGGSADGEYTLGDVVKRKD